MLLINKTKQDLIDELEFFIWEFKVGDNIKYNLNVLYELIDDYNGAHKNYGKPISVTAVSIMEAIMIDFIYRLYRSTNHFPDSLREREGEIKSKLSGETIRRKFIDTEGKKHEFSVLKNFNLTPMIEVYRELQLLGDNEDTYKSLIKLAYFRNRVHIDNYYNNFEKDEIETFSEKRVQQALNIMVWVFNYFKNNYKRQWSKT